MSALLLLAWGQLVAVHLLAVMAVRPSQPVPAPLLLVWGQLVAIHLLAVMAVRPSQPVATSPCSVERRSVKVLRLVA